MAEEAAAASERGLMGYLQSHSDVIRDQFDEYGYLIGDSLGFILIGMLTVFLIHRLANRFLYPLVDNKRFLMVTFATLYVLVLVVTGIMVLKQVGFAVNNGGAIAILAVLFLAVLLYFIIPFLPRLPFVPGHVIETHGVMGTVDTISTFHTTIRQFDGTMVFIPNAMVMASKILNFSYIPHRRIEMKLLVTSDSELDVAQERLLAVAASRHSVLADPPPAVFATQASASGVELVLYCWVENADFLSVRSALWQDLLQVIHQDPRLHLSLPQQEVHLRE